MADEVNLDELRPSTESSYRALRRTLTLNADETDFEASGEARELDAARLVEFKRAVVKMALSDLSNRRLMEKMSQSMGFVSDSIRVVVDGKPQGVGNWSNVLGSLWQFSSDELVVNAIRSLRDLIAAHRPMEIETLFTTLAAQHEAKAFVSEFCNTTVLDHDRLLGLCQELAIPVVDNQSRLGLEGDMEKAVYGTYAGMILQNSILSGQIARLQADHFASGIAREINELAVNSLRKTA